MTLIACYLDQRRVIQVSDTRLTNLDGSIYDDSAVKAIGVSCKDAEFAIAYTGLAEVLSAETIRPIAGETTLIGAMVRQGMLAYVDGVMRLRTDTFIESFLDAIDAPNKTRQQIASELRDFVGELFNELRSIQRLPRERTALTIQVSGFDAGAPFCLVVSNARDEVRHLGEVSDQFFISRLATEISRSNGRRQIWFEGAVPAIKGTVEGRISATRRRIDRKSDEEGVAMLVSMVRDTTRHREYGYLIGRSCLASVVRRDGTRQSWSYPEGDASSVVFPHVIGDIQIYGATVTVSRDNAGHPASVWTHRVERS